MAESKTRRRRSASSKSNNSRSSSGSSSSQSKKRSSARSNSNHDHSPREIVIEAVRQLQELVGRPIEAVTGIEKNGKEWKLSVEVLELERVPNTTDVLGRYEVTVDQDGDLTGARRTRRYARAEAGED